MRVSFDQLGPDARIWIYQSTSPFTREIADELQADIQEFTEQWSAHQQPLAAYGEVLHHRFVVLMVDERLNKASGCSIDASVAFIRGLEEKYSLQLFDRMTFSFVHGDQITTVPKEQFSALYKSGEITEDTVVFDNLIRTKAEWDSWQKPLGKSWLMRFV